MRFFNQFFLINRLQFRKINNMIRISKKLIKQGCNPDESYFTV